MNSSIYPNIDMKKTGILLKEKIAEQGYTVRDIQNELQLSCPQPVYRWFKGRVLPSLDNLLMLSRILKVHMEELLVVEENIQMQDEGQDSCKTACHNTDEESGDTEENCIFLEDMQKRLSIYRRRLAAGAA